MTTNPYFEPFTLDGEQRKPIVEYEGFAVADGQCHRCRVLERLDEFGLVTIGRQGGDFVARLMPYGNGEPMFAVASDRDAALNELAHRIAKEAGL